MDTPQTSFYTAAIVAVILIGIIIAYFIISLIRHQRRIVAANQRNIMAERALLEKEHMRIAADLHDELCPVLAAIKFQVDSLEPSDDEEKEIIITSKEQIDFLATRLRSISHDLMPTSLTRKNLVTALTEFFTLLRKVSGLRITFQHNFTHDLPEDKRINCYRIIQEITHNCIKHARASELLVRLTEKNNMLQVLCEDNGIGFNYQEILSEDKGLGLRNIKGRADIISDNFKVFSVAGKGTQFTFDIPLNESL